MTTQYKGFVINEHLKTENCNHPRNAPHYERYKINEHLPVHKTTVVVLEDGNQKLIIKQ